MEVMVDARGFACPEPVIRTKKALKQEHDEVTVLVDNKVAVENVKRLAGKQDHTVSVEEIDDYFKLVLKK